MVYILEFFAFSLLGWIINTIYCSLEKREFVNSGYFRALPLCPIYGIGGILLINVFAFMVNYHFVITILVTTALIVNLELFGGWLSEHVLEEKLWDYSKEPLNLYGYISAWHSFLWLILVTISYILIGHRANEMIGFINSKITLDPRLEVILVFEFLIVILWLTMKNKKARLKKLKPTMLK